MFASVRRTAVNALVAHLGAGCRIQTYNFFVFFFFIVCSRRLRIFCVPCLVTRILSSQFVHAGSVYLSILAPLPLTSGKSVLHITLVGKVITLVGKVMNLIGKVIAVQEAFVSSLIWPLFLYIVVYFH